MILPQQPLGRISGPAGRALLARRVQALEESFEGRLGIGRGFLDSARGRYHLAEDTVHVHGLFLDVLEQ